MIRLLFLFCLLSASAMGQGTPITVYVSSSEGSDTNDGMSEATPKKTFVAAKKLFRPDGGDRLLLKRGDTFEESLFLSWNGFSPEMMACVDAYGEGPRPLFLNKAIRFQSGSALNHFAIRNLEFYSSFNDPSSPDFKPGSVPLKDGGSEGNAIQLLIPSGENLLIENVTCRYYDSQIQIRKMDKTKKLTGVTVRNCQTWYAKGFGLLLTWLDDVVHEDCFHHMDGWNIRTKFLHNVYAKELKGYICRRNTFSHGGNFGLKLSSDNKEQMTDVEVSQCRFIRCGLSFGHSSGAQDFDPAIDVGILRAQVSDCWFTMPGKTLGDSPTLQTVGIFVTNLAEAEFRRNTFSNNPDTGIGATFAFSRSELNRDINIRDTIVEGNWLSNWYKNSRENTFVKDRNSVVRYSETGTMHLGPPLTIDGVPR